MPFLFFQAAISKESPTDPNLQDTTANNACKTRARQKAKSYE